MVTLNVSNKATYHLTDDGFQKDYCIRIAGLLLEEPDEVDAVPDAKYEKFIGSLNKCSIYSHRLWLLRYQLSGFCILSMLKHCNTE